MLDQLMERYPKLTCVRGEIEEAYRILEESFLRGGKLLAAGNGGSAADAEHIVGEVMKGFVKRRPVSDGLREALINVDPELGAGLGAAGRSACNLCDGPYGADDGICQ